MVYFDPLRSYIYEGQYDRGMQFYAQNKARFPPKGKRWDEVYTELENVGRQQDAARLKD